MLRSTLTFVALCGVSSCFQGCHSTDGLTPPDPKTPWVPPPSVGLGFEPPVLPSLDDFGPMGVGDCLAQALEHQPQTRRFWNQALAQAAYHQEQKATLLPTGGLTAGVEQQDMQFKSTANLSKSKVDQTLKGAGVNLQWVLFSFGARTALIEGALHGLYGANFRYNQALQDMALNVQMSYYELQSAKAQLVASKARRSEAESTLDAVQTKFLTGLADQQERFRAQAEYASANYTLQAAYGLVENARAQLAQAMGVKVHQGLDVLEPELDTHEPEALAPIEEWLQDAMANRPVLKQAYQDWQRLESESKAAKSAILPQVVATAGASRYSGIENGLRPDRETAIGIGIQWQIFDFFQDQAKALQMRHQADAAKAAYESQQLAIASEVWQSFYSYKAANAQMQAANEFVLSAKVAFQATQKGYLSGIKNLTDLLQSQEALARARSDQVEAYRKSKTAWAQMLYAIGGLSFDELARPRPTVTVLK